MPSPTWHGVSAWGEAGSAFAYLTRHLTPDYRGGVSLFRGWGRPLGSEAAGLFADTSVDALYVSRFNRDFLAYWQNRWGYTTEAGGVKLQFYLNTNATTDAKRQYWANFVEVGPGVRFRVPPLPPSLYFTANILRGVYTLNAYNPRRPNFIDVRAGFGYAFTR